MPIECYEAETGMVLVVDFPGSPGMTYGLAMVHAAPDKSNLFQQWVALLRRWTRADGVLPEERVWAALDPRARTVKEDDTTDNARFVAYLEADALYLYPQNMRAIARAFFGVDW